MRLVGNRRSSHGPLCLFIILSCLLRYCSPTQVSDTGKDGASTVRIVDRPQPQRLLQTISDSGTSNATNTTVDIANSTSLVVITPSPSPVPSVAPSTAAVEYVVEVAALFSFTFPDTFVWSDERLNTMQYTMKEFLDEQNNNLQLSYELELSYGDTFGLGKSNAADVEGTTSVDVTLVLRATEEDLSSSYVDQDLFRQLMEESLKTGQSLVVDHLSEAWGEGNGFTMRVTLKPHSTTLQLSPSPTIVGTLPQNYMIQIFSVISFSFTDDSFWNEGLVTTLSSALKNFLSDQELFEAIPVGIEVSIGDIYNLYRNHTTQPKGRNQCIQLLCSAFHKRSLDSSRKVLCKCWWQNSSNRANERHWLTSVENGSTTLFQTGFKSISQCLFEAPTVSPTQSPTTSEYKAQQRRKQKIRSYSFMSVFWLIVVSCFALENGLCACKRCCRRKKRMHSRDD
eukprot:g9980.t1 g9980   contig4:993619-994977(+)